MPGFKEIFCFLFPITLNVIDQRLPHSQEEMASPWEQTPGPFAPYATEITGKKGEYISGWSDGSRLPGVGLGNRVAATELGKGDAAWNPRGSLGQFLVLPLPMVKMNEKQQPTKQAKKAGPAGIPELLKE